jgi:hypothetical protein
MAEVTAAGSVTSRAMGWMAPPYSALRSASCSGRRAVAALYRSDPRLAHAVVDVEPRVARLLEAMLEGMLA